MLTPSAGPAAHTGAPREHPHVQDGILDDEGLLSSLALDPFGQLAAVAAEAAEAGLTVSIDEVQRLRQLTLALKRIVDKTAAPVSSF